MTSKISQSSATQRQIPEYIREQYPAFVDFLKMYYEFLEDTQSQSLEQYKDIDTTLEEFLDKFKSELARNIPLELVSDKRNLIKRLRDFYLARGSEASYKFLFRVFFNKEAEIFYPSSQILRASDGKWKQDVSVFVKTSGNTLSLFPLDDSFVTIVTPLKTIRTYVERVVKYRGDVYEVFIQREYANFVTEGSTIEATLGGVTYTGDILGCPTSVKVIKTGTGFSVGQRFSLKTSLGEGCLVKVTRVDSSGGILAVQVVKFGLDYTSTFWSYLSSKTFEGIEYVSPATKNSTTNPPYVEYSGGFEDGGFLAIQDYMIPDSTLTVASGNSADAYFSDTTYVGEVVGQFYQDQSQAPFDQDMAIIQVNMGYVAKYPGYYITQDGFLSDEMYIQDGNYYQTFSYVIRVEEEFRKYIDIVKSLLHPAGLKVFGDYTLVNILNLQASSVFVSSRRQFTSTLTMIDGGFDPLTSTVSTIPIKTFVKALGSDYTLDSLARKTFTKRPSSILSTPSSDPRKTFTKGLTGSNASLLSTPSSSPRKTFTKEFIGSNASLLSTPTSSPRKTFTKEFIGSNASLLSTPTSSQLRVFTKRPTTSTIALNDSGFSVSTGRNRLIQDTINTLSQITQRQFTKRLSHSVGVDTLSVGKSLTLPKTSSISLAQSGAAFLNAYIQEDYFLFNEGYLAAAASLN